MDFRLSSEQQALADSVASFCARDYDFEHRRLSLANEGGFSPDNWQLFAELGWLGAGLGEDAGGYGGGAVENAIILEALPLSPALRALPESQAWQLALAAGDDYELCFTAPPGFSPQDLPGNVPVTRIGTVTATPGLVLTSRGVRVEHEFSGYQHF